MDTLATLDTAGRGVTASTSTARSSLLASSMESTRCSPVFSEVALAMFQMRPATFLEMGSSAVSETCASSSTSAARAKPMAPSGCGPAAGLPAHTWRRRSSASKVSEKAMPSASMPTFSWKSFTAASVCGP